MIIISHRGNLDGPNPTLENSPNAIEQALAMGFHVEVDMWGDELGNIFLGHDNPCYPITGEFLARDKIWVHCKNSLALGLAYKYNLHYFWHQDDDFTITSKQIVWAYPGKQFSTNIFEMPEKQIKVVNVMPEQQIDDEIIRDDDYYAICTDYPTNYIKQI